MASVSPRGAASTQTALPSLAVAAGGWVSEADPTADKWLCARLTCQSVLTRSNTSHMFASRSAFVVVLFCCCTLRARVEKEHTRMAAPVERVNIHTRQMGTW